MCAGGCATRPLRSIGKGTNPLVIADQFYQPVFAKHPVTYLLDERPRLWFVRPERKIYKQSFPTSSLPAK